MQRVLELVNSLSYLQIVEMKMKLVSLKTTSISVKRKGKGLTRRRKVTDSFDQIRTTEKSDVMLIEIRQTLNTTCNQLEIELTTGMFLNFSVWKLLRMKELAANWQTKKFEGFASDLAQHVHWV